jgi:type IV pilus assembly protein PilA
MKTEFQAKFLQHLLKREESEKGFTLIELLVVIIIIGILSAIALPSFLNQANKAKQSEAKQYVGSMNRSQQAYYLEKNSFTDVIGDLGLGIRTETQNYQYSITREAEGSTVVTNHASIVKEGAPLKAYVGGVSVGLVAVTSEATTLAVLCEGKKPLSASGPRGGETFAAAGDFSDDGAPQCTSLGSGDNAYEELK